MSSFTMTTSEPQQRTQRRLVFEGFNVHEPLGSSRQYQTVGSIMTSTPEHKSQEKPRETTELTQSNELQSSEHCLVQLQNARQLLHTMSRTNVPLNNDLPSSDDVVPRSGSLEFFNEANPELAYYKSSLESERNRRKQLESLVDVQQQRLTEAESELIVLRANDHKKTLCMKQLEQMIPNVVDEWKQKEIEYKSKLTNTTQQLKQMEQAHRDKLFQDKQKYEEELSEKNLTIERLTKDQERWKQDCESAQTRSKQQEQRIQQLVKDGEQAKQRYTAMETDIRNEIRAAENRNKDLQSELDRKQHDFDQMMRDHQRSNSDLNGKVRQLEHELDEQRRENNVLKMELELREAKYRAQMESLKIQLLRETEAKIAQRLEEQHAKHIQIEEELNELNRRKLTDLEQKYEHMISNERQEYENRIKILMNKLEQMKSEFEKLQSSTMAERQDLARKLQDVFETALLKGSNKAVIPSAEVSNISPTVSAVTSAPISSFRSQPTDTQVKEIVEKPEFFNPVAITNQEPPSITAIRSLSSRIDSLVDHTNRVTNGFDYSARDAFSSQNEINTDWIETNQNRYLPSRPHSELQSPYFRSTPIDPMQEWLPSSFPSTNLISSRSHSADPTSTGVFSTFPSQNSQQQQSSSNALSLDNRLHLTQYQSSTFQPYRSASSLAMSSFPDHQYETHGSISKDSIEKHQDTQPSSNNESLTRYVKMLLERSPTQEKNVNSKTTSEHPLAKTNRSLHDIRVSLDQLNLVECESKSIVDDLAQNVHDESQSPRGLTPRRQKAASIKQNAGRVKKRLDYDVHNNKQTNTSELFERLSQPKTRPKKDKPKSAQPSSQSGTNGQGVWK